MSIFHFSYKDHLFPKVTGPLLLGNFDGLHLGHQALIEKAKEEGEPFVLLLDRPFKREGTNKVLTTLSDKARLFASYGVSNVLVLGTEPSFFELSKDDFISLILKRLNPPSLVVGEDYSFGFKGEGKVFDLKRNFSTFVLSLLEKDGKKIGTTLIKNLICEGKVSEAASLLGRPYEIKGKVQHGFQNGRKIDFPTANLAPNEYVLPRKGVYCGYAFLRGSCYKSIINVGDAPTVGKLRQNIVEAYLDGFKEDCYDETLYLDFVYFLREERKFENLDADEQETLTSPTIWYDYNNMNNKFVISEISADDMKKGIIIARTSKR